MNQRHIDRLVTIGQRLNQATNPYTYPNNLARYAIAFNTFGDVSPDRVVSYMTTLAHMAGATHDRAYLLHHTRLQARYGDLQDRLVDLAVALTNLDTQPGASAIIEDTFTAVDQALDAIEHRSATRNGHTGVAS